MNTKSKNTIELEVSEEAFEVLAEMGRRGRVKPESIGRLCIEQTLAQSIDTILSQDLHELLIRDARDGAESCTEYWEDAREHPGTYGSVLEEAGNASGSIFRKGSL